MTATHFMLFFPRIGGESAGGSAVEYIVRFRRRMVR
jgi:hypothetical protein